MTYDIFSVQLNKKSTKVPNNFRNEYYLLFLCNNNKMDEIYK